MQINVYGYTVATARETDLNKPAGGRKDMDERLTAKELDRLADWLTAQGLTPEKVLECIKYIAGESAPAKG